MNLRKNSVLIFGCGIAGILLIVAVFFLVRNQGAYRVNMDNLNASKSRLQALNERDPFPSNENIKLAQENLEFLKQKFDSVQLSLIANQLAAESIEPARFAQLLEQAARRVLTRADAAGVQFPTDLGLGFKAYAAGKLPSNDPAAVQRLVLQVKNVEDLCTILIDAKVKSIDSIVREEFEVRPDSQQSQNELLDERGRPRPAPERPGAPTTTSKSMVGGIPPSTPNELYTIERMVINFTGWESAIWEALNQIASRKVIYAIVDVTLENTKTDNGKPVDLRSKIAGMATGLRGGAGVQVPGGTTAPSVEMLESISREDRIVGGREPVKARVVVDMYRFIEAVDAGAHP